MKWSISYDHKCFTLLWQLLYNLSNFELYVIKDSTIFSLIMSFKLKCFISKSLFSKLSFSKACFTCKLVSYCLLKISQNDRWFNLLNRKNFFFLSKQPKYFICQWLFICQTLPKIFPTWQNRDRKLFFFSFFTPVILFHLSFSHLTIHSFYFYSLMQSIKVVLMRFL